VATALRKPRGSVTANVITADLVAVLAAVTEGEPKIMTIAKADALPSGPFEFAHRSLQSGLRAWVEAQTGHQVGAGFEAHWSGWYDYFPWEDHRAGAPALIAKLLTPRLRAWAKSAPSANLQRDRWQRVAITFGLDDREWNEELVLQRYELLYEASLIPEAVRDGGSAAAVVPGRAMTGDHRRILATGIARLRAKIKYRPVVFELMPAEFTLLQLQRSVEALAGRLVHKQNFRRLMEQQQLVEETGAIAADTVGRPAKLFRFRYAVLAERAVAGTKVPLSRT
jgi:hypothetical protein